eukprot:1186248-Prorocentrum_minimum.AAC.3
MSQHRLPTIPWVVTQPVGCGLAFAKQMLSKPVSESETVAPKARRWCTSPPRVQQHAHAPKP